LPIDGIEHDHFSRKDMLVHVKDDIFKFWFALDSQKFSSRPEDVVGLMSAFEEIWQCIDVKKWQIPQEVDGNIP